MEKQNLFTIFVGKPLTCWPRKLWKLTKHRHKCLYFKNAPNLSFLMLIIVCNRISLQILYFYINEYWQIWINIFLNPCNNGKIFFISSNFVLKLFFNLFCFLCDLSQLFLRFSLKTIGIVSNLLKWIEWIVNILMNIA